jgi:hypothetical protein
MSSQRRPKKAAAQANGASPGQMPRQDSNGLLGRRGKEEAESLFTDGHDDEKVDTSRRAKGGLSQRDKFAMALLIVLCECSVYKSYESGLIFSFFYRFYSGASYRTGVWLYTRSPQESFILFTNRRIWLVHVSVFIKTFMEPYRGLGVQVRRPIKPLLHHNCMIWNFHQPSHWKTKIVDCPYASYNRFTHDIHWS